LCTLTEAIIAFVGIFLVSSLIYIVGRWLAPKPAKNENEQATYACGEKPPLRALKINVSSYRYLIYFVIFDSSVLLVAFAALAQGAANMLLFMFYLLIMLVSVFLLTGGSDQ